MNTPKWKQTRSQCIWLGEKKAKTKQNQKTKETKNTSKPIKNVWNRQDVGLCKYSWHDWRMKPVCLGVFVLMKNEIVKLDPMDHGSIKDSRLKMLSYQGFVIFLWGRGEGGEEKRIEKQRRRGSLFIQNGTQKYWSPWDGHFRMALVIYLSFIHLMWIYCPLCASHCSSQPRGCSGE